MNTKDLRGKLIQIKTLAEECLVNMGKESYIDVSLASEQKASTSKAQEKEIGFNLNSRAFFKKYGKNLSGPNRFVLVVAYLAKGKTGLNVSTFEVKKHWNKNQKLLGGKLTTGVYGTRAKENGWIDPAKDGSYHLTTHWREIFK